MAKKQRKPRPPIAPRPAPAAAKPAAKPAAAKPAAATSWWFDFELSRDHLALFRFAFFAVLAVDAFLQIGHAPRYGAGDFNVPHFAWLPLPVGREAMLAIDLLLTYLFAMAAFGIAPRVVVPLAAGLDAYYYFSSQLDSYQHHYLVVLLLFLACFVPWESRDRYVRSWALRLILVQVAVLYGWAAIAKLDPLWLDGTTLRAQLAPKWARSLVEGLPGGYGGVSIAVLLTELGLAAAWLFRRWTAPALLVGLALHVGIEASGFRIGQFSYIMIALYLLLLPTARVKLPELPEPRRGAAVVLAIAVVAGAATWLLLPLPAGGSIIVVTSAIAIGAFLRRRTVRVGAAHLAACLLVLGLAHGTDQAVDYYRYWAGSARRLGNADEMRRAYRELLAIAPGHGSANYYLGHAALEDRELDRALDHFRRTQAAEPGKPRAVIGEARVHLARGDVQAARSALEQALRLAPGDREAAQLLQTLDDAP